METLRGQAEFLRLALAMGLIGQQDVVAWADTTIGALDEPPVEIIDVALAGNAPVHQVMSRLAEVPGQADLAASAHRALALLRQRVLRDEVSLEDAVRALAAYHCWARVPEQESLQAGNFEEWLYLAQQGKYGTLESVREELLLFLAEHQDGGRAT
jgi:hypothetical protein